MLSSQGSKSKIKLAVGSNFTIAKVSHEANNLPIGPIKLRGPKVLPSSFARRWRKGSSFAWNIHAKQLRGRRRASSSSPMTPSEKKIQEVTGMIKYEYN